MQTTDYSFPSRPTLQVSNDIYRDKYLQEDEAFEQGMYRIAGALADDEKHRLNLKDILLSRRFLPAGRVQAAIGAIRKTTPYNCFVSGTIEDSMNDIMLKATEAADTMRLGGGIGYNFSGLRPEGAIIRSLQSVSSGPISFMGIFNAVCGVISSAGHRRGAQMGVLNVDHPDIMKFIHAKNDNTTLTNFNISVGATDKFMKAVKAGTGFDLMFNGEVHETVDANALWDAITRMTWDYAEPGVLFIDQINRKNNLWYCEKIEATNPCGEQPLPPYGACLLGSFNLPAYLTSDGRFDIELLVDDVENVTRAMDNVIDQALYPLEQQKIEAQSKRRMGLGVTGLSNVIEFLGKEKDVKYGDKEFLDMSEGILEIIKDSAYLTSIEISKHKGAFELLDVDKYLESGFMRTMPEYIREDIRKYGIRNSHLTSIAPTGTISLAAENVSSGLEPPYALIADRVVRRADGNVQNYRGLEDYGSAHLNVKGRTSEEATAKQHVDTLITASRQVDSACSKTCNVGSDVTYRDFQQIYMDAYDGGASGCTTFRPDGKRFGIISKSGTDELRQPQDSPPETEGQACYIDPNTGERSCSD